jgi:hypothetical protein
MTPGATRTSDTPAKVYMRWKFYFLKQVNSKLQALNPGLLWKAFKRFRENVLSSALI